MFNSPQDRFVELKSRTMDVIKKAFPIQGRKYVLDADGWMWSDVANAYDDKKLHKTVRMNEGTLASKLYANLTLKDLQGKTVETKRVVVALLPTMTDKSSFIVDGKELNVINQLRLRPGLYSRFTHDNNVETFVNTSAAGTYRVVFDREEGGKFKFRIGTGFHIPLTTVLRCLGVTDAQMISVMGKDIFELSNAKVNDDKEVQRLYERLRPYNKYPGSLDRAKEEIKTFLGSKPLDPAVNKITLNESHASVTGPALLDAAAKCIRIAKGSEKPDDTESLAFKSLHSFEDFIPEKIEKSLKTIQYGLSSKMDRVGKITGAFSPLAFTTPIKMFFNTSEFSRFADQTNPVEMVSVPLTVTTMGEGGITSQHAVADSIRLVHPSHIGVLDPVHTPEGQKVGITNHLSPTVSKRGTAMVIAVINAKTGAEEEKTVTELDKKIISFPDNYDLTKKPPKPRSATVTARVQAEIKKVPATQVEYIIPTGFALFGLTSQMVPFLHTDDALRVGYADRHIEQAINLKNPDAPLVSAELAPGVSYDAAFGRNLQVRSKVSGKVTKITEDVIEVSANGKKVQHYLNNKHPLNGNTYMHDTPAVAVGDKVSEGQVIATNNFTKDDRLALGKNLRVAYMPYKGYNFEDGFVISHAASQKLTSLHQYEYRVDVDSSAKLGLGPYLANFPDQAAHIRDRGKYDNDGIIKKGAQVHHGDLLIPIIRKHEYHADYDLTRLHKALSSGWSDSSAVYDHDAVGVVTEVVKTGKFVKVFVSTEEAAVIGDKISHRHGGKGIIVKILPDNEMLQDEHGKPIDVLFNPAGVPGRVNPGQLYEAAAGKLAKVTGKPFLVKNFDTSKSTLDHVQGELKKAGLDPHGEETVTDPISGRKYPRVLVGDTHFIKLRHQVAKKFAARGVGGEYTINEQPAKTDEESAQRIGGLELYALLAGDATKFVHDAFHLKSNRNDEYWRNLQLGLPLPKPKVPFVAEKFNATMLGAGIHLHKEGDKIKALPITDHDILRVSSGAIQQPTVITASDLKPEKGGLFDPGVTGGIGGTNWNHIELPEPIVNPLATKAVAAVLGIPEATILDIMAGRKGLQDGKIVPTDGHKHTGGDAIKEALSKIDVDAELSKLNAMIFNTKSAQKLDSYNKKRRYLLGLKSINLKPHEAYMNKYVPVIPPKFRAVYPLPDGSLNVADANHGYREVLMVSNALKDMKSMKVDPKLVQDLRGDLFKSVSGLVGLTEPITRESHFKGFLEQIKGVQNKTGFFQGRLLSRPQDLSARTTVIPDPKLGLDEVGIPKEMAMSIYKPFIVRRLVNLGYTPVQAREMTEKQDPIAIKAALAEAAERPVVMNRSPSLHKFNVMAFYPRLVDGRAVQVNPLIVKGYNMDFDGDTTGIHVPVTEEAKHELKEKLLPSKNLFSPSSGKMMHAPAAETVLGLYLMSKPEGAPAKANSEEEIVSLYKNKKANANTAFAVNGKIICPGMVMLNHIIPAKFKLSGPMTSKVLSELINGVAKETPTELPKLVNTLKDLGNHYVTEIGFSISLRDLKFDTAKRDNALGVAQKQIPKTGFGQAAGDALKQISKDVHSDTSNRFVTLTSGSGALGGKASQVTRMLASPVAVTDHAGKTIPIIINKSFAEGFDIGSYWSTLPGGRRGLMDKGLSTADTGYLTKLLVNANIDNVIREKDCGTDQGVELPIDSKDVVDRVVANGPLRGTLLTPARIREVSVKHKTIKVRSPLYCRSKNGTCQMCFGASEDGRFYPIGYHIGILAAQTIGEPTTQLTLRTFHTAGSLGTNSVGYQRVHQIFSLPENVTGKSVLANVAGKVTSITPATQGGWNVVINKVNHYVPKEVGLKVKLNQMVNAGEQISLSGLLRPQDLLHATNDVRKVQDAIIHEVDNIYKSSDVNIKRRIFETVVKPLTNKAVVRDPGDAIKAHIHIGDIMDVNTIEEMNKHLTKKIVYDTHMLGIEKVPHHNDDFIGRMMHERLFETMKKAPMLGLKADAGTSGHVITRLAMTGVTDTGLPKKTK